MQMLSRWVALVALCVANSMAQSAPQSFAITGTVVDPSGGLVPGASVTLKNSAGTIGAPLETNTSGSFRWDGISPGQYSIEVRRVGFKASVTPLRVSNRPLAALRITLALADLTSEVSVADAEPAQVSSDATENRDSATVGQNLLDKLPVFDQDYIATMAAFLDAGSAGSGGTQLIGDGM